MNSDFERDIYIAPGAQVVGDVRLGRGCSVWHNAVLRGDEGAICVDEESNIQDCAVLHEALRLGRGCTVGHGAIVHGCTVGDNCLIGMGAILLSGARVGDNCVIGAGALLTGSADIPAGSLVMGSPAKVVRALREEEIEGIRRNAALYLDHARRALEAEA
ncbi:MAG: gamma carbonic anhydrase family protein [Oscillospiraceae bacterium]